MTNSERCEAEAKRLEEKAVDLAQLLGVLVGEDENVKLLITHHQEDAKLYRRLADKYRSKGL